MDEQAALKSVTKEQTASLQTALLHGHIGLSCGPRCEPLSGAPFQSRGHRRFEPPRVSCVFRTIVTDRFGIVTAEFGNVTGHFGDVTDGFSIAA